MSRKLLIELDEAVMGCASIALDHFDSTHRTVKEVDTFTEAQIFFAKLYDSYHALPYALKEVRDGSD